MIRSIGVLLLSAAGWAAVSFAADSPDTPAPSVDRVGFPKGYHDKYPVSAQSINRTMPKSSQCMETSRRHGSRADQLPYPYGSIIVMETASATKDARQTNRRQERHL